MTTASTPADPFATWIATATSGLCADAVTRIREELLPHYEDTVEHLIREGAGREEAEAQAVQQLGNARKAQRGFRRTNLTVMEQKRLTDLAKLPALPFRIPGVHYLVIASPYVLALVLLAFTCLTIQDFAPLKWTLVAFTAILAVPLCVYLATIPVALPIRLGVPRLGIAVFVVFSILCVIWGIAGLYVQIFVFPLGNIDRSAMQVLGASLPSLVTTIYGLVWLVRSVRLFQKLGRAHKTLELGGGVR
ncbi:MAG: permease prefix domain 1-containing protein [Candidatus Hydrogenedentes bacterium]|nr:permease prefix domain 1-containing protein [Candidatus Hydrogenedentota bacterium]